MFVTSTYQSTIPENVECLYETIVKRRKKGLTRVFRCEIIPYEACAYLNLCITDSIPRKVLQITFVITNDTGNNNIPFPPYIYIKNTQRLVSIETVYVESCAGAVNITILVLCIHQYTDSNTNYRLTVWFLSTGLRVFCEFVISVVRCVDTLPLETRRTAGYKKRNSNKVSGD